MKAVLLSAALAATAQGAPIAAPRLDVDQLAAAPENEAFKRFLTEGPADPTALKGKRVAVVSADGVEEIELTGPIKYLKDRGAKVDLVAPRFVPPPLRSGLQYPPQRATHILTVRFFELATWQKIDRFLDEVVAADYDAVIIPGGAWNPDTLRIDQAALTLLRDAARQGKVVAAICHGPLVLVNAGLVKDRAVTATWNVHADIANAGGKVLDQPVVVDGELITSRFPTDLPDFMDAIAKRLLQ